MSPTSKTLPLLVLAALAAACGGDQQSATMQTAGSEKMQAASDAREAMMGDPCRSGQTPTAGPVEITLTPGGQVQVRPAHVKLARGSGGVDFDSDRPFVVIFQQRGGTLPTRAATASNGARGRAPVQANPNAQCGRYKYSVAVWDSAGRRMVGIDPPIDIVPTGSMSDSTSTN